MKRKKLETIGTVIAAVGSGRSLQKRLLLQEICQFQFRSEPVCPDWPVNNETVKTLINAVLLRAMERAEKSLDLGNYKDVAKKWERAASSIVCRVKELA